MKLSVIVPVYNEKDIILKLIELIKSVPLDKEIIVVDDCSTDGTGEALKNIKIQISNIKIIYHSQNQGKGAAIRSGLKYASGEIVIIQDGDLEYNPADYLRLLTPIENHETEVVYGSRFKGGGKFRNLSFMANKFLTFLTNLLYSSSLTDMETCYKCIKIGVMKSLDIRAKRFEFEPEVTAKLLRKGYKILEVPISYCGRYKGKKIGVKDFVQAIFTLIKWSF